MPGKYQNLRIKGSRRRLVFDDERLTKEEHHLAMLGYKLHLILQTISTVAQPVSAFTKQLRDFDNANMTFAVAQLPQVTHQPPT